VFIKIDKWWREKYGR